MPSKKTAKKKPRKKPTTKRGEGGKFIKGESGNPNGRPKLGSTFSETARELLEAKEINVSWTMNGKTKRLSLESDKDMYHGMVAALIIEGLKGNTKAIRELIDRTEGKAMMRAEVSSTGDVIIHFDKNDKAL